MVEPRQPLPQGCKRPVGGWVPPPLPFESVEAQYRQHVEGSSDELAPVLSGLDVDLVPLSVVHAGELYEALTTDMAGSTTTAKTLFDFLPIDGVANEAALKDWISMMREDTTFFLLTVKAGTPRQAVGFFSLMRATPKAGSIETGWVTFSPALQRTRAATEAFYLLLRYTFNELGYRRHEWKCDAANLPSRRAAQRLGFSWEGLFRNAAVVKGLNRDTAWFAMTCEDWLTLEAKAFQPFLSAENFDSHGLQRVGLSALTAPLLHATDPLQDHQRAQLALGQQA